MAERRLTAVQSLKRPFIPYVARDEPDWMQAIENSMAEIKERFESMFTSLQRSEAAGLIVSGQLRRLWQR